MGGAQDTGCCGYEEYDSEVEGDCGGVRGGWGVGGMETMGRRCVCDGVGARSLRWLLARDRYSQTSRLESCSERACDERRVRWRWCVV